MAPVVLDFDVHPYPTLNYSVLHNGKRQMFERFRIYKFSPDVVKDVRVEVSLNIGAENFGFRGTFEMVDHILDLSEAIAVGLTSSLSRSLRESVRTTVFVRVTKGADDERFCKTFDVSLLAVDEWKDDPLSGVFLPSFVLPRDPSIAQVIARAQRYLMALADDVAQGFDGYQSRDDYPDDPAGALEVQARAIWYALQHDFALKYVNPPPTFSVYSQRLRVPSDILKGGRGTCIDLALILAACFEYIGLHPVIFLMRGHAFCPPEPVQGDAGSPARAVLYSRELQQPGSRLEDLALCHRRPVATRSRRGRGTVRLLRKERPRRRYRRNDRRGGGDRVQLRWR